MPAKQPPLLLASIALLAAAAASVLGCAADDPGEVEVGAAAAAVTSTNALTANALTANALTANALTANALTANALTANALTDPAARDLLRFVVACALPAGEEVAVDVDGEVHAFAGELGLAAEWGEPGGRCDGRCQRWVSACVLARLNAVGARVEISMRGFHPALAVEGGELRDYRRFDGAYYGNVFAAQPARNACLPDGETTLARVCGPSLEGCVLVAAGPCRQVCDPAAKHGAPRTCRDAAGVPAGEVIAVYLR